MAFTNKWSDIEAAQARSMSPMPTFNPAEDLMTRRDAAAFLDITETTFSKWVAEGHLPPGIEIGSYRKWSKFALTAFIWEKVQAQAAGQKGKP